MTSPWGPQPARKSTRGLRWWITLAVAAVVLVILLILAPALIIFLAVLAFLFALVVLLIGRARWARIPHRKAAAGVAGGALALMIVAGFFVDTPETATTPVADAAAQETPAATAEPELASFVGQACDGDELVMTQDGESNYCDANDGGAFVWVAAVDHEKAEAAATARASEQAAKQAKAEKSAQAKAAKDKAAVEAKARQKAAAQKKADAQKAEARKVAAEKKATAQAQAKKAAQQASARKEAAAQAARNAEKRAAEQAAVARKNSFVAPPAAPKEAASTSTFYKNCTAVRAAGADPIHVGDPGYSRKLDRDGDGVGCE